jgi:hypothetical protein
MAVPSPITRNPPRASTGVACGPPVNGRLELELLEGAVDGSLAEPLDPPPAPPAPEAALAGAAVLDSTIVVAVTGHVVVVGAAVVLDDVELVLLEDVLDDVVGETVVVVAQSPEAGTTVSP